MLYSLILLTILILYALLVKYRFKFAILCIIACLPLYLLRFNVFGVPTTVLEVMILISFGYWVFYHTNFLQILAKKYTFGDYLKEKSRRIKYPFGVEIMMLLGISFIAIFVSGITNSTLGIWKAYFFEPILVYLLILNNFQKKKDFDKIFIAITLSCFMLSVYAIFQKITGIGITNEFWQTVETRRVTSVFPYPNALSLYLAPCVLILVGWTFSIFDKNKKLAIFTIITVILSIFSIYFAKSEAALVAISISLIIFFIINKKTTFVGFLIILIFGISTFFSLQTQEYLKYKISLSDKSEQIRLQQWKETWQMLNNGRLFTGSGLNNYSNAILPYHQEGIFFNKEKDPDFRRKIVIFNDKYRQEHWQPVEIYLYPHNIFLNFWVELGLAGMILFIWIIGKFLYQSLLLTFKNSSNKDRFISLGLFCSMLVIFIHGLFDVPYFKNDLAVFFWILISMFSLINTKTIISHTKSKE